MRTRNIDNISNQPSFGKVILKTQYINEIAKNDFDTKRLWNTWENIIKKQEHNPVNIYLDRFTPDANEYPLYPGGWYISAKVNHIMFNQRVYNEFESPIAFLKRAALYANICSSFTKAKNKILNLFNIKTIDNKNVPTTELLSSDFKVPIPPEINQQITERGYDPIPEEDIANAVRYIIEHGK